MRYVKVLVVIQLEDNETTEDQIEDAIASVLDNGWGTVAKPSDDTHKKDWANVEGPTEYKSLMEAVESDPRI